MSCCKVQANRPSSARSQQSSSRPPVQRLAALQETAQTQEPHRERSGQDGVNCCAQLRRVEKCVDVCVMTQRLFIVRVGVLRCDQITSACRRSTTQQRRSCRFADDTGCQKSTHPAEQQQPCKVQRLLVTRRSRRPGRSRRTHAVLLTWCNKLIHWWVVRAYDEGARCTRFVDVVPKPLSLTRANVYRVLGLQTTAATAGQTHTDDCFSGACAGVLKVRTTAAPVAVAQPDADTAAAACAALPCRRAQAHQLHNSAP